METILFQAEDVTTSYKKFTITNISFELANSDIMGLMGRSGSGKSTIIKTLIGLKKPNKGKITSWVDEKKVPLSRFIGFSPQSNSLYPFLTVEENIYTFGRLYSVKHHIIKERMKKLLSELRLDKNEKKKIIQLSGGMQKRADLAVTLIHDPKIIFLDEPFAGLDISLRKFLWNFLKSQAKEGKIIVISSHAIGELEKNCTQFGLITNNRFYNTEQIKTTMRTEKQRDLTTYLTGLFSHSERI